MTIQNSISLDKLIPGHPKLSNISLLWQNFSSIMGIIKSKDAVDVKLLSVKCKEWVQLYVTTYQAKDVTPYMHVLMYHVPEAIRIHGDINIFSQQGMEKMNDSVTSWYFRSSNHNGIDALQQVMMKQNRVEYLGVTCQRDVKFTVTCSVCHTDGHNKRTCEKNKASEELHN